MLRVANLWSRFAPMARLPGLRCPPALRESADRSETQELVAARLQPRAAVLLEAVPVPATVQAQTDRSPSSLEGLLPAPRPFQKRLIHLLRIRHWSPSEKLRCRTGKS